MIPGRFLKAKAVLDAVLKAGGGEFIANSEGEAVHVRQKCYRFRTWYRQNRGISSYDDLEISRNRERLIFKVEPDLPGQLIIKGQEAPIEPEQEEEEVLLSNEEMKNLIGDLGLEIE